jgi:hypothetical protein
MTVLLILSSACVIGTGCLCFMAICLWRFLIDAWSETLNGMAEEMR